MINFRLTRHCLGAPTSQKPQHYPTEWRLPWTAWRDKTNPNWTTVANELVASWRHRVLGFTLWYWGRHNSAMSSINLEIVKAKSEKQTWTETNNKKAHEKKDNTNLGSNHSETSWCKSDFFIILGRWDDTTSRGKSFRQPRDTPWIKSVSIDSGTVLKLADPMGKPRNMERNTQDIPIVTGKQRDCGHVEAMLTKYD